MFRWCNFNGVCVSSNYSQFVLLHLQYVDDTVISPSFLVLNCKPPPLPAVPDLTLCFLLQCSRDQADKPILLCNSVALLMIDHAVAEDLHPGLFFCPQSARRRRRRLPANEAVSLFLAPAALKQREWLAGLKLTDAVNVMKKDGGTHLAAAKKAAMNFVWLGLLEVF